MQTLLTTIRSWLGDTLLRPNGLAHVGPGARVQWPRRLRGKALIHLGARVRVDAHCWIEAVVRYRGQSFEPSIVISDDVTIGRHATITATGLLTIGAGSLLSEGVYISDHGHDVEGTAATPLASRPLLPPREVRIGERCFIGLRACILPGVTLGDGCIVGANAVVTRSFAPGSVIAGSPARLLRSTRNDG